MPLMSTIPCGPIRSATPVAGSIAYSDSPSLANIVPSLSVARPPNPPGLFVSVYPTNRATPVSGAMVTSWSGPSSIVASPYSTPASSKARPETSRPSGPNAPTTVAAPVDGSILNNSSSTLSAASSTPDGDW